VTEQLANSVYNPTAQLSAGIDDNDLSLTVSDVSEFIDTSGDPLTGSFRVLVWDAATDASKEIIKVGAFDSGTGVCSSLTRAVEGKNAAQAHAAGDLVELVISAGGLEQYVSDHSGGGTSTQTATVSTDPDSYDCSHIFDLGGCAIVSVTTTLTTFTGDGETLGSAPGDIQLAVDVGASFDGVTFLGGGTGGPTLQDIGTLTALSMVQQRGPTSLRYLKILCAWDDSDFNAYAGPNHPVGTVHIVVEYIAT
jgi:hypothetical protein